MPSHFSLLILAGASLVAGLFADTAFAALPEIIPRPSMVREADGKFTITAATVVVAPPADAANAVRCLTDRLKASAGIDLKTETAADAKPGAILLTTADADASLGDEGYTLDVTPAGVVIRAPKAAGLFYGVQSLLQMLPPAVFGSSPSKDMTLDLPCVSIKDQPRFRWRGLHFDVARHFFTKAEVLRLIDEMAMHKLNVLHWHLVDDQGWRIEIKKYPKLTSVGAWRDSAGFAMDPNLSTTYGPDGKYGGFYTQDDVREVVAYAAARQIMVVPEIEMPGHATAALRAYPDVGTPAPPSKETKGDAGIFNGVFDPSKEETFTFLQDVLSEVIELFPSPYIHIGGDETPKGPWLGHPPVVAFMKEKGIPDGEHLQSYFIKRIDAFLTSKGRRTLGWDEILEGGLAPGAAVMSWRGVQGGLAAATAGHDVVMTPVPYCYIDGEQAVGSEPHERGAVLTVQKVYSYEPIPAGLPADRMHHVLGVQANLWTEYVPNFTWAEYLYWPRGAAIAEIGWTAAADRNWDDFARRLTTNEKRLDAMGVNYRPLQSDTLKHAMRLDGKQITIDNPVAGATVRYTLDGTFPTADSPVYSGPVAVPGGWAQAAARYFVPGQVATPAAAATFLDGRAVRVTATHGNDWETRTKHFYLQRWGGAAGDEVTVSFDAGPQPLKTIAIDSGDDDAPDTKLKAGTLEVSADGKTFTPAGAFKDGSVMADVSAAPVLAFRVRFTELQTPRPVLKTVTLTGLP